MLSLVTLHQFNKPQKCPLSPLWCCFEELLAPSAVSKVTPFRCWVNGGAIWTGFLFINGVEVIKTVTPTDPDTPFLLV